MALKASERTWPPPNSFVTVLGLFAALLVLPLALAPRADGYVYWTSSPTNGIARAKLDGSGVNPSFITAASSFGVAVDARYVYWADSDSDSNGIARAKLDGSGVNPSFIANVYAMDVAVDASHVYWTSPSSIGRANLDGTHVDKNFIPSAGSLYAVAVDAKHLYWPERAPNHPPQPPSHPGSIARAKLDGTHVDRNFIANAGFSPLGVAVDPGHIYWVHSDANNIARANLDGTHVDTSFIRGKGPYDVAVDAGHVYWTNLYAGTIGRAKLDGSGVNQRFITGADDPWGVTVNSLPDTKPPKTKITAGAPQQTEKTTLKFRFNSSEPNSSFECRLDRKPWRRCSSPKKVRRLNEGGHKFQVRSIDAAGNTDPTPAKDKFKVVD